MPKKLLFIHGWATDSGVWDGVARAFGAEHENIRLPGHGNRKKWLEPSIAPAVRVVEEAVASVKGAGVVGIGWSLGAQALMKAAARSPKAFKALVLVGATPRFVSGEGLPGQRSALVKRMILDMKKDPGATVERFYALNFTGQELRTEAALAFIERYKYPGPIVCSDGADGPPGCYPAFDYAGITMALEALYNTDLCAELKNIKAPVLVLHGEEDNVCPVGAGRFLAEAIEGAELKVIDGAGHAPFITARDEFVRTIKRFLSKVL